MALIEPHQHVRKYNFLFFIFSLFVSRGSKLAVLSRAEIFPNASIINLLIQNIAIHTTVKGQIYF